MIRAGGKRTFDAAAFDGAMTGCRLCPRRCGAERAAGRRGFCGAGDRVQVYTWRSHPGEEPPVSGTRGSGTVFFSRCTMRCLYCQNYRFSQEGQGEEMSVGRLRTIMLGLANDGCHNWNLVSPTPWLPFIARAVTDLRDFGVSLPVVYNTSGYESVETIRALDGMVDVYLADLRYSRPETAAAASSAPDYVETARAALLEMWRLAGPLKTDPEGVALSGTICRILVLPDRAMEAVENLRWLAGEIGPGIAVSVMAQYTPAHRATGIVPWNRRVGRTEYGAVRDAAERLGFSNGWIQDYSEETSEDLVGYNLRPQAAESSRIDGERKT